MDDLKGACDYVSYIDRARKKNLLVLLTTGYGKKQTTEFIITTGPASEFAWQVNVERRIFMPWLRIN